MWDDDNDFMAMDKEDREETGRRLSDGLAMTPIKHVMDVDMVALTNGENCFSADDGEDAVTDVEDMTLDEIADRYAGSLS